MKGTTVEVVAHSEAASGDLLLESGTRIDLKQDGGVLRGTFTMNESGVYQVRLAGRGESGPPLRASDDYFMEATDDQPPTVAIKRPGRDEHPTSVEEVVSEVTAGDDYGLKSLELRYTVNGGPEQKIALPLKSHEKDAAASPHVLSGGSEVASRRFGRLSRGSVRHQQSHGQDGHLLHGSASV